jgi:Ca2+-binding RTX toxin-like protein
MAWYDFLVELVVSTAELVPITIKGTNGADALYGSSRSESIYGYGGNDTLKGFGGADRLDGGTGIDTAFYGDSTVGVGVNLATGQGHGGSAEGDTLVSIENVWGSEHNDTLTGNDGANELYGLNGNDVLKGGGGADGLAGGDGDDILKGGGGADYLEGGPGIDTADYSMAPVSYGDIDGVYVDLNANRGFNGDAALDHFSGIENVTGSDFWDTLVGDSGHNVLRGLNGHDTLRGNGGNDTLDGGPGVDSFHGDDGNDIYIVDYEVETVWEYPGYGVDTVRTSVNYALLLHSEVEVLETTDPSGTAVIALTGNEFGNQIIGNNGDNVIDGRGGVDQLVGRGGNDTYRVDNAADSVAENGGQGLDTVYASVSYVLTAGADVETLRTGGDNNVSAINLTGNANGNVVIGNNGNNVLNGGDGNDELTGLAGQDSFWFNTALDAATNVDVITDFSLVDDTIVLDDAVFGALDPTGLSAGEFVVGAAAQDADDYIIYDDVTGALLYDSDGSGGAAAIQFAELSPGLALGNQHFDVM